MPGKARFAEILESYQKEIYRYTFRMTGNPDDAADLLQDTFLRACKALPRVLAHVVRDLTPRQRSALLLKKYEGLPYRDVAEILGMSPENARAGVPSHEESPEWTNGLTREES